MEHNIFKLEWSILRHPVETQELPNVTFFTISEPPGHSELALLPSPDPSRPPLKRY